MLWRGADAVPYLTPHGTYCQVGMREAIPRTHGSRRSPIA